MSGSSTRNELPASKRCKTCGAEKPIGEFRSDGKGKGGRIPHCRDCKKAKEREYLESPKGQAARRASKSAWNRRNAAVCRTAGLKWLRANPHKKRAVEIVKNAINRGRMVRQPCERCGRTDDVEAHHDDYSKPLEVRWLCPGHHKARHAELNRMRKSGD